MDAIDKIRDTSSSHHRTFVIEAMGRTLISLLGRLHLVQMKSSSLKKIQDQLVVESIKEGY